MTEQKHTPGPWRIEMNDNYMKLYMPAATGLDGGDVARGYVGEANAHLIAAAPALLAALEEAKQFIQNGIECGYIYAPGDEDALARIKKAIRKAKGVDQ